MVSLSFPCGSAGKKSTCNVGDLGLIPGLGRSPAEGKGYPTPVFCPGEFSPWGCKELDMTEELSLSLWLTLGEIWQNHTDVNFLVLRLKLWLCRMLMLGETIWRVHRNFLHYFFSTFCEFKIVSKWKVKNKVIIKIVISWDHGDVKRDDTHKEHDAILYNLSTAPYRTHVMPCLLQILSL